MRDTSTDSGLQESLRARLDAADAVIRQKGCEEMSLREWREFKKAKSAYFAAIRAPKFAEVEALRAVIPERFRADRDATAIEAACEAFEKTQSELFMVNLAPDEFSESQRLDIVAAEERADAEVELWMIPFTAYFDRLEAEARGRKEEKKCRAAGIVWSPYRRHRVTA
jgi:hypothetical protein